MEEYIGTIQLFGFDFAPRGWALCNGQLLPISQYTALFSLLGTKYGGDGITNFALPDLRGRAPIHYGQGPGLSNYIIGQKAGTENVTITSSQMPAHNHGLSAGNLPVTGNITVTASLQASDQLGDSSVPVAGNVLSKTNDVGGSGADVQIYSGNTPNVTLGGLSVSATPNGMVVNTAGVTTGITGGSQPLPILNPFLVMNFCICIEGIFPSRN